MMFQNIKKEQVRNWIFEKGLLQWDAMSNLPKDLKNYLSEKVDLLPMEPVKVQRFKGYHQEDTLKLRDNQFIESVLIRATEGTKGVRASRLTLCVSTQVGCALGCKFCASGLDGLKRNLTTGEIVGQVLMARNEAGRRIDNLVFMGMGEPLANLPALLPCSGHYSFSTRTWNWCKTHHSVNQWACPQNIGTRKFSSSDPIGNFLCTEEMMRPAAKLCRSTNAIR